MGDERIKKEIDDLLVKIEDEHELSLVLSYV